MRKIKSCSIVIYLAFFVICSCGSPPEPIGPAGMQLMYMVPGDKITLDNGKTVYVDQSGILRGTAEFTIRAAGRKVRDVIQELSVFEGDFVRYQVTELGPRYVEVAGDVRSPGKYRFPRSEDWNMMNLILKVGGFISGRGKKEYLLIRRAWPYPNKYAFVRGFSLPSPTELGGDDVLLFAEDVVIFPGEENPVYIFGSVRSPVCLSLAEIKKSSLENALQKTGKLLKSADTTNIQVFRVLRLRKQSIFHLSMPFAKDFELQEWDVVYIPPKIPKGIVVK